MPNAWGKSLPRLNRQTRKGGNAPCLFNQYKEPPKREREGGKKSYSSWRTIYYSALHKENVLWNSVPELL